MATAQEHRDQDQTEEKSRSSVRPKATAQERRDLDYMSGYGLGITGETLPTNELWTKTVAYVRGYRAGMDDFAVRKVA